MVDNKTKVVVMGLGYIGLPTASMLATKGYQVLGVDISERVVATINSGKIHIVEPDLDILVRAAVASGNLVASLEPQPADVYILAVPTPFVETPENPKAPDTSYIAAATRAIAPCLRPGNLIVLESTSPVGTTEAIGDMVVSMRPDLAQDEIHIVHCPERVLPGNILKELVNNDRIIGGLRSGDAEKARDLYRSFCSGDILLTDSRIAEMSKLVENSFRDVNIAFANELSLICDKLGMDVWELIRMANKHPRVNILQPGPGVGGHCIAVDPWFVVASAPAEAKLIRAAREVNDGKPHWVVAKVRQAAASLKDPLIGCLGLAFKPNIDDLRESPAVEIAKELARGGFRLVVCEPHIESHPEFLLKRLDEVLTEADILVVLVDHDHFRTIDPATLGGKQLVDTRGLFNKRP